MKSVLYFIIWYVIIDSISKPNLTCHNSSVRFIQLTCDSEREHLALRGEVMRKDIGVIYDHVDLINTAVVSCVGVVRGRKQEVGEQEVVRVTDSWLGVVVCCVETAVVPWVGVVCGRKQEVVRVIDSCHGVVLCRI